MRKKQFERECLQKGVRKIRTPIAGIPDFIGFDKSGVTTVNKIAWDCLQFRHYTFVSRDVKSGEVEFRTYNRSGFETRISSVTLGMDGII